jgi:hypothetical protein
MNVSLRNNHTAVTGNPHDRESVHCRFPRALYALYGAERGEQNRMRRYGAPGLHFGSEETPVQGMSGSSLVWLAVAVRRQQARALETSGNRGMIVCGGRFRARPVLEPAFSAATVRSRPEPWGAALRPYAVLLSGYESRINDSKAPVEFLAFSNLSSPKERGQVESAPVSFDLSALLPREPA